MREMLSHLLQKRFSDSRILKLKNINTILHSNIDLKKKRKRNYDSNNSFDKVV